MLHITPIHYRLLMVFVVVAIGFMLGCGNTALGPDVEKAEKPIPEAEEMATLEQELIDLAQIYPGLKNYDLENLLDADALDAETPNPAPKTVANGGSETGISVSLEQELIDLAQIYPGLKNYDLENLLDADALDNIDAQDTDE